MSLLILPVIIIAAKEVSGRFQFLRLPPSHLVRRVGKSFAPMFCLSSTRHSDKIILALSRAIGETAPLIMIGALTFVAFLPESPMDEFTALPIQIFNWTARPQETFHEPAAGGIIVPSLC